MANPSLAQAVVYGTATSGTTISATFGSNTTSGNAILVLVDAYQSSTIPTISSGSSIAINSGSASFQKIVSYPGLAGSYPSAEAWIAYGITGGATPKITVTLSSTIGTADLEIYEWANVFSSEAAASGTGTMSASKDTASALTTTNANDVLFAFISTSGGCTGYSSGWPSAPTFKETTQNESGICYLIVTSTVSAAACVMDDSTATTFCNIVFALSNVSTFTSAALNWDSTVTKWDQALTAWDAGQPLTWDSPLAKWDDTYHAWDEGNVEWDSGHNTWDSPSLAWDAGTPLTWDSRSNTTLWDSHVATWDSIGNLVPSLVQHVASGMDCNAIGNLQITFPNPTLANNGIIACVQYASAGSISSVTDSQGNAYTLGPSATNSTYGQVIALYYCVTPTAGVTYVQFNFSGLGTSGQFYGTQGVISEWAGTAGIDGAGISSSSSVSPGTITTTQEGDLLYYWAVDIQSFHDSAQDGGTFNGTSISAATGFTPLSVDLQVGSFDQYKVLTNTDGPISPTCTPSGSKTWASLAIAFLSGDGTLPSTTAMRIVNVAHTLVGALSTVSTAAPIPLCFPSRGNLLVALWNSPGGYITGITDSASNTWSVPSGAKSFNPSGGYQQLLYAANATTSATLHNITISTGNSFQQMFVIYDVVNAASSPFDTATNTTGNATSTGAITGSSITPSSSGGIVFSGIAIFSGTINGMTVNNGTPYADLAVNNLDTDNPGGGGSPNSPLDEDNGYGHVYNANTSSITFSWPLTTGSPAAGYWSSVAASFISAGIADLSTTFTLAPGTLIAFTAQLSEPTTLSLLPASLLSFTPQLSQPDTLAVTSGTLLSFTDQLAEPTTLAVTPETLLSFTPQLSEPTSLTISPATLLSFTDTMLTGLPTTLTLTLGTVLAFTPQLSQPTTLAITSGSVLAFTDQLSEPTTLGVTSGTILSFTDQLSQPTNLTIVSDTVLSFTPTLLTGLPTSLTFNLGSLLSFTPTLLAGLPTTFTISLQTLLSFTDQLVQPNSLGINPATVLSFTAQLSEPTTLTITPEAILQMLTQMDLLGTLGITPGVTVAFTPFLVTPTGPTYPGAATLKIVSPGGILQIKNPSGSINLSGGFRN